MNLGGWITKMHMGLRAFARPTLVHREIEEELDFHLEMERRKLGASGMTRGAARAEAQRRFGNLSRIRAACRKILLGRHGHTAPLPSDRTPTTRDLMESLIQDLRQSLRLLLKNPGFTAIAALSLGIGIGANTTIFTVMNALLLRPLPVAESDRLIEVATSINGSGAHTVMYQDFRRIRDRTATLEDIAGSSNTQLAVSVGRSARMVIGSIVTGNYFDVMGIEPRMGRFFLPDEDRTPATHPVVVISERLWQKEFGGNPNAVGSEIVVNNYPFVVIGVAPAGFTGTGMIIRDDLWVPIMMTGQIRPNFTAILDGRGISLIAHGRLADGVTSEQAGLEMRSIGNQLAQEFPRTNENIGLVTAPARAIPAEIRGPLGGFMGLLLVLTGLVLTIACVNLANMLLARSIARGRDFAVRMAMGAGRIRLIRQMLTETLVLYGFGAAIGITLSLWATRAWVSVLPSVLEMARANVTLTLDLGLDWRVTGFALAITLATGVVFGTLPALRASRPDLVPALKDGALSGRLTKSRLRNTFVVTQIAVSLVLLVGAGLFLRTIRQARNMDPGFDADNVTVAQLNLGTAGMQNDEVASFYRSLTERLGAVGNARLEAFAFAADLPLDLGNGTRLFNVPGQEPPPNRNGFSAEFNVVTPGYFDVLSVRLLRGRDFSQRDEANSSRVAVVNAEFAERFWPNQDPIGQRVSLGGGAMTDSNAVEIIGVMPTIKYRTLAEAPRMALYVPLTQAMSPGMSVVLRSSTGSNDALAILRQEIEGINPDLPVQLGVPLGDLNAAALLPQVMAASVTSVLGVVALLLVTLGIYGVVSYTASQRVREMGIRVALGSTGKGIVGLVLRQGMRLSLIGVGLGITLALLLSPFLAGLLVGVSPNDPITIVGIGLLLAAVAAVASYLPARRAARVDPMVALRYE